MSIFPQDTGVAVLTPTPTSNAVSLPMAKEYAWDFDNNDFLLMNGKNVTVTGKEAVKVWLWKAFQTKRYKYLAYSWNYGQEFESMIGQGFGREALKSEVERCIRETVMINPYITEVKDITITLDDVINAQFTVSTLYGEVIINV